MWVVWVFAAILGVVLCLIGWVYAQYRRFRRFVPKEAFRETPSITNLEAWKNDEVTVGWVGHSTMYMNLYGIRVLTDPVFSQRIGVSVLGLKIGPKRHTAPALTVEDVVGKVDIILLSHAHMDHVDLPSLRKLASPAVRVVTAKNTSRLLRTMPFGEVMELGTAETVTLDPGLTITAVDVRHWGARFPWNKTYAWTGFLIGIHNVRVFYAGDTAYTSEFQKLSLSEPVDIACIPIGAYSPDSFQRSHCTPEQAWEMFREIGARWLVPVHWDTFVLSQEPVREPMMRLLRAAGDEEGKIVIRDHGDTFSLASVRTPCSP